MLKLLSIAFTLITISVSNVKADYGIGVGRADVTGPAAEVTFVSILYFLLHFEWISKIYNLLSIV